MFNRLITIAAREGLNRFKMEDANEVGVNLKQGYNGDLNGVLFVKAFCYLLRFLYSLGVRPVCL